MMKTTTFESAAVATVRPAAWRRRALLGGGALVAVAAAAGMGRAVSTGMVLQGDEAFDPWQAWATSDSGDPLSLVAAAVLAASPHNTQPWMFRLRPGAIDVLADTSRHLGAFDPFARELWHGLGAAIANIEIAATVRGFAWQTQLQPDAAADGLAARIALRPGKGAATSPLAAFIDQRRTNRAAYDPQRPVPADARASLGADDDGEVRVVWLPAGSPAAQLFTQATLQATRQISDDAEMSDAGHHWFRANPKELARHRDGLSTPTAGIDPFVAAMSPLMPPVNSRTAGEYWLRSTETQLATAPLFGLLVVRMPGDRRTQLLAGARWQRLHLQMTRLGLAAQPINQLVEVADRDRQLGRASPIAQLLGRLSGDATWQPTFAFRTGYASTAVPQSARRRISDVLVG